MNDSKNNIVHFRYDRITINNGIKMIPSRIENETKLAANWSSSLSSDEKVIVLYPTGAAAETSIIVRAKPLILNTRVIRTAITSPTNIRIIIADRRAGKLII
jgi:hypothetical protein